MSCGTRSSAGTLLPGESLSIQRLGEELGTSHIPVREALRRLSGEGLVSGRPTPAPWSPKSASRTCRPSTAFDGSLKAISPNARLRTSRTRTSPDCSELGRDLLVKTEDGRLAAQGHIAFHRALVAAPSSPWDLRVLEVLWRASERYVRLILAGAEQADWVDEFAASHEPLVEAATARSGPDVALGTSTTTSR